MVTEPNYSFRPPTSIGDSMLVALFFAAVIHVLIILGVNFTVPEPEKINKSISITIANSPTSQAPEKADFLAQENQQGAGNEQSKKRPPAQQIPSQGKSPEKRIAKKQVQKKPAQAKKVITQKTSDVRMTTAENNETSVRKNLPQLSPDALARQVAQLGAEIRYNHKNAEQSRIKFINSVSTHKYLAALYILDWQNKVEKTGNLNYPKIARKKRLNGKLTMDVGINHVGTIYSMRINKSSGYKALDDAAKRIVQMSAPFAPLPKELIKELDVLVITRVWRFSDRSGMSAQ